MQRGDTIKMWLSLLQMLVFPLLCAAMEAAGEPAAAEEIEASSEEEEDVTGEQEFFGLAFTHSEFDNYNLVRSESRLGRERIQR